MSVSYAPETSAPIFEPTAFKLISIGILVAIALVIIFYWKIKKVKKQDTASACGVLFFTILQSFKISLRNKAFKYSQAVICQGFIKLSL